MERLPPSLLVAILLIAVTIGTVLRVLVAFQYPIFVDEGANLPNGLAFFQAYFSPVASHGVFQADLLKPQFGKFPFGLATWLASNFGQAKPQTAGVALVFPIQLLAPTRLVSVILSLIAAVSIFLLLRRTRILTGLCIAVILLLDPVSIFWGSLVLSYALLIPLLTIGIVLISDSRLEMGWSWCLFWLVAGLAISVQYSMVILIVLPAPLLLVFRWTRETPSNFSKIRLFRDYAIGLGIAASTLLALNPYFWVSPIASVSTVINTIFFVPGAPFGLSSGVFGVPTFYFGTTTLQAPWYVPLAVMIFQIPVIILAPAAYGFYLTYKSMRLRTFSSDSFLPLVAIAELSLLLIFTSWSPHLRSYYSVALFIPALTVLAGFGISRMIFRPSDAPVDINPSNPSGQPVRKIRWRSSIRFNRANTLLMVFAAVFIALAVITPTGPTYTNGLALVIGTPHEKMTGAWGSAQADADVGRYIGTHYSPGQSVLVLGLTDMVAYYAPQAVYSQIWNHTNASYLIQNYRGQLVVIDQWYVQLWGGISWPQNSPVSEVYSVSAVGGYSNLYYIHPLISNVSPIYDSPNQDVFINGTGLGSSPQLVELGTSGYFDTIVSKVYPSIQLVAYSKTGKVLWGAGTSHGPSTQDGVGLKIASWTPTQIEISGWGPNVVLSNVTNIPMFFSMQAGDSISITVMGPNSSGTSTIAEPVSASGKGPYVFAASSLDFTYNQTVRIQGSGFSEPPPTFSLGSGYVDTYSNDSTFPPLWFMGLNQNGTLSWTIGFASPSGRDSVGFRIVTWQANQIVLGGFGPIVPGFNFVAQQVLAIVSAGGTSFVYLMALT